MLDQAVLDLGRTDAISGGLEHVVGAALVPQVTVVIDARLVAGARPLVVRAAELLARRVRILEVLDEEHRVRSAIRRRAAYRDLADFTPVDFVVVGIENGDAVPRIRASDRTW